MQMAVWLPGFTKMSKNLKLYFMHLKLVSKNVTAVKTCSTLLWSFSAFEGKSSWRDSDTKRLYAKLQLTAFADLRSDW